jgi:hypothetical protein
MIRQTDKLSRVKTRGKGRLVFERVDEFEISSVDEAKFALRNIASAIVDTDTNIARLQKHKDLLEFERMEVEKFLAQAEA